MDKLSHFCFLFAANAQKHSSYDIGAKSKFFAIRITKCNSDHFSKLGPVDCKKMPKSHF